MAFYTKGAPFEFRILVQVIPLHQLHML
jgi:hypothetical protein